MKVDPQGAASQTGWRVVGRGAGADGRALSFVEFEPLTGRTHQIRVHAAAMGWPVAGDRVYGLGPMPGTPALQLHAREVVVPLPKDRPVRAIAPVPAHMRDTLSACGWQAEADSAALEPLNQA